MGALPAKQNQYVEYAEKDAKMRSIADAIDNSIDTADELGKVEVMIAPEFSATANYSAGDYVRHEGKLYKFAAPHSAGAWTGTDVIETNIGSPLKSLDTEQTAHTARISLLQNDITNTYNGNSTYNTGDLCMHDYKLYKCKEDSVTGTWDETKWEQTNIISEMQMENIVDSDGNKRFIEGSLSIDFITGLEVTYSKWSLSATHLMIVVAGNTQANTSFVSGTRLANVNGLPLWLINKMVPIIGISVLRSKIAFYDSLYNEVDITTALTKGINNDVSIFLGEGTITNASSFRLQFDLLID